MNWTDAQNTKLKRDRYRFAISMVSLFFVFGGVMAATWVRV
jgi:hypothetical protein